MAGLPGKQAWIAAGKQTAKGTIAGATKVCAQWPLTDGSISPTRDNDNLAETDDSRDAGATYIKETGVSGNPSVYGRDNSIDVLLAAALGTVVDSGSVNFTHTITPATALPYVSFWRMIGNLLWESFTDCMVSSVTVKAEAGGPMTIQANIMGLTPTRLTSDPSAAWTGPPVTTLENGYVYNYKDVTVTIGGGTSLLVSSFELTFDNNITLQQTNSAVPYDLVPGTRELNVSFDLIFETLAEYNKFHYGGSAGTAEAAALYSGPIEFIFANGVNNSIDFQIPLFAYEEFPVEANADGSPVVVSVRGQAQRGAPGVALATFIVKNQKAVTFL